VSKARTVAEGALAKVKAGLESAVGDAEALMQDVEAEKEHVLGAVTLVKSRLAFALSVLDSAAPTDLESLLNDVREKRTKQPCKLWEALLPVPQLDTELRPLSTAWLRLKTATTQIIRHVFSEISRA